MGYPPMKSSVTEDELVRLETRHKPMKYPRRTKEVCGWDSRLWPCDVAILVAALRATPVADTAGIDAARSAAIEHLQEHVTFADLGTPTVSVNFDYGCSEYNAEVDQRGWRDARHFIETLHAALRTPKPEGERE